jgi:hypothetical protein
VPAIGKPARLPRLAKLLLGRGIAGLLTNPVFRAEYEDRKVVMKGYPVTA